MIICTRIRTQNIIWWPSQKDNILVYLHNAHFFKISCVEWTKPRRLSDRRVKFKNSNFALSHFRYHQNQQQAMANYIYHANATVCNVVIDDFPTAGIHPRNTIVATLSGPGSASFNPQAIESKLLKLFPHLNEDNFISVYRLELPFKYFFTFYHFSIVDCLHGRFFSWTMRSPPI